MKRGRTGSLLTAELGHLSSPWNSQHRCSWVSSLATAHPGIFQPPQPHEPILYNKHTSTHTHMCKHMHTHTSIHTCMHTRAHTHRLFWHFLENPNMGITEAPANLAATPESDCTWPPLSPLHYQRKDRGRLVRRDVYSRGLLQGGGEGLLPQGRAVQWENTPASSKGCKLLQGKAKELLF